MEVIKRCLDCNFAYQLDNDDPNEYLAFWSLHFFHRILTTEIEQ